jgi:hypothetical protein
LGEKTGMNKEDKKILVSSLDLTFEKTEWTKLDEKLSFLEELSDQQIVRECKLKFSSLKEVPQSLKLLYSYVADFLKVGKTKVDADDRYIMSIFLAYSSPSDLDRMH